VSRKETASLFLLTVFHSFTKYVKGKGTAIPIQAWQALKFQEVKASRYQASQHMKIVGLSALRIGRLYP
jgi:O-acetylhomoserine/O-acetylserine sulfhydrylase-like pyridoxal-dependent enzyme